MWQGERHLGSLALQATSCEAGVGGHRGGGGPWGPVTPGRRVTKGQPRALHKRDVIPLQGPQKGSPHTKLI